MRPRWCSVAMLFPARYSSCALPPHKTCLQQLLGNNSKDRVGTRTARGRRCKACTLRTSAQLDSPAIETIPRCWNANTEPCTIASRGSPLPLGYKHQYSSQESLRQRRQSPRSCILTLAHQLRQKRYRVGYVLPAQRSLDSVGAQSGVACQCVGANS
jgi:hypothetical protein